MEITITNVNTTTLILFILVLTCVIIANILQLSDESKHKDYTIITLWIALVLAIWI